MPRRVIIAAEFFGGWAMPRVTSMIGALAVLLLAACTDHTDTALSVDLLVTGGLVFDGGGGEPFEADVAVRDDRIVFVGNAMREGVQAPVTINAAGKWVAPGFIDMHSHAELDLDYGRDAAPFLYQGISTVVLGVDGDGEPGIGTRLANWDAQGIGVNGLLYIGHGAIRSAVMGSEDRKPTSDELDQMRALVRQGMEDGAFGLSTGLFYVPGIYANTDEIIELARVAAEYAGAIYDTHDRDLGASYEGVGYDESVKEGIRIGEASRTRVIFSHFNLQGAHNRGRADVGAHYINAARERGVDVWAAQHPYTATQSSLRAYTIPAWAAAGGDDAMVARFDDPEQNERIIRSTYEMLEIRGGADRILLVDERPELNGKTLAQYASDNGLAVHDAVQAILRVGNAKVMNLDLYDPGNTRRLAIEPWMMTCTDGRTPRPDQPIAHPRTYGAFPMKFRLFVLDEQLLTPQTAVRSFSGLAADFLRLPDRGYLREDYIADLVVIDPAAYRDRATYAEPRLLAEGVEHLLVNGRFAIRDGMATGALAGRAIRRPASAAR